MTQIARGPFQVKMLPMNNDQPVVDGQLGRMALDKSYAGDLIAVAHGQMLTGMTETQGSAAYVAIEKVTGSLHGRNGSFILQHTGTMNRGNKQLSVQVVPDSGTGELTGLSGQLQIIIENGAHHYELEYQLP